MADVSLQTGQSLLLDDVIEKKAQLTKQTSTTQMPSSTTCHSLTTQTTQALLPSDSAQTQEAIKVLKTTKGDHDVIEIATKYVPSSSSQDVAHREQSSALPSENIVVDMKYQDAQKAADSATSELNIVHVAPQSFETVVVEPDDITTEVVVDADGTKRIIVRKLRRTMVTSRQTTQQRVSTLSTTLGDAPPTVQAFSEAAMRDQQVTVTRTRPDGTIETTTRQIYGGRVTTGAPAEGINVEEYESEPCYTRIVTQGQIGDIGSQPIEEEEVLVEGGEYQTKTSSVHAVVQQVTRKVIKRTRKIIRKVTVVDGKETTTEEVIEEPEEIEIDEQDIPHISINVVKSEDQKMIAPKAIEMEREESLKPEMSVKTPDSPMQGPFFGPFAKDIVSRDKTKKKTAETPEKKDAEVETVDVQSHKKDSAILEEPMTELDPKMDSKLIVAGFEHAAEALSPSEHDRCVSQVEDVTDIRIEGLPVIRDDENGVPKETELQAMEEESFPIEVKDTSTLMADSQALLDAERYAVLQTPAEDVHVTATQAESVKTSLESTDDEPAVTKAICKSDDAPVKNETLTVDLENGTVEIEKQHDGSSTVDTAKDTVDVSNIVVLKEEDQQEDKAEVSKKDRPFELARSEEKGTELPEEVRSASLIPPSESDIKSSKLTERASVFPKEQEISSELLIKGEDHLRDEAFKPEYKPLFHKVEISLSVREENAETEPLVSIKTQAERPDIATYSIVKEDVNISLPVDKKKTEVIHDKIVQTSAFLTAEKQTETSQQHVAEKEVDAHTESSERSKSDTASHKSRKKKRRKRKPESSDKSAEMESSTSIATSIAESMDINIPSSDSSQHASEQPQPDVAGIIEPIIESSLSISHSIEEEDTGYQADDKTMDELSVAPSESGAKKKRKKKKMQKVRLPRHEDATQVPKTSSDDVAFTDDSLPLEIPKLEEVTDENKTDETRAQDVAKETEVVEANKNKVAGNVEKVKAEALPKDIEKSKPTLDDANTQTTVDTCDVSTALSPKPKEENLSTFMQTSPEPTAVTLDEEIQTTKTEESHIETQTIVEPGLDFSAQTITKGTPEVEDSGIQTATPTATPMEESAMQTIPMADVLPVVTAVETENSEMQTVEIDVLSTEMQTSPVGAIPMTATETQTAIKTATEVEQQTTPPPAIEETTVQESAVQTSSPEMTKYLERDMQTSAPISPEQPDISHVDTQTIVVSNETMETQTICEEYSPKVELQETEMQTKSPEPTIETTMQTSPIIDEEAPQVCDESAQTCNIEETKQTTERESQTSSPEKIQTLDSSVQLQTEELIPQIEESVQNIPETSEISAQTSPKEEKRPAETTSVYQQTTEIPIHDVTVSTEDFKAKIGVHEDAHETLVSTEPVILEKTETEEEMTPVEIVEIPAAPDVQVPESARVLEKLRKAEDKSISEIPRVPENIEQIKTFIEEEVKHQLSKVPVVQDSTEPLKSDVTTKESTSSSISENATSDTSFEIHVHASIELPSSDISQTTTIAEDFDADVAEEDNKVKRQRRKRRHETMEITLPSKSKPTYEPEDIILDNIVQQMNEEVIQEIPDSISGISNLPMSTHSVTDSGDNIPKATTVPESSETERIALDRSTLKSLVMPSNRGLSSGNTVSSPEPMDTTEEPLTPIETEQIILSKENIKPFQPEIKTYAEMISKSDEKPAAPILHSLEMYEKEGAHLWKEPITQVPSSHALSAEFLLKESLEHAAKPQHYTAQTRQTARMINDRVKNLQNTNESSHLSSILHIAHLEEVTIEKPAEKYSSDVRKELTQLRHAVQENDVVVVEEILVTVIETISTWLKTIEYRVFLNKECPTGPSHEDAKTFNELKEEENHVEKTVHELENIWKEVEPSYSEDEQEKLQECVSALKHQMKIIEHITVDGERHATKQLAKWDEFLNGVNNVYR